MRLLLDTHVVVWSMYGGRRLSTAAREVLEAPNAKPFVSMATIWEVAIKQSLARRDFSVPDSFLDDVATAGVDVLPVTLRHAWSVRKLEGFHGDPFDRMIVVQAKSDGLVLVTHDRAMTRYGAEVVLA